MFHLYARFAVSHSLAVASACALAVFSAQVVAWEGDTTVGQLRTDKAVRVAGPDLDALVRGGKNESYGTTGMRRQFEHHADGTLRARRFGNFARPGGTPGTGTWRIDPQGRYCLDMVWETGGGQEGEKWCASIYRSSDGTYFAAMGSKSESRAWKQAFTK